MSNYLAKNTAAGPGATPKRRRKLWLASGVAGLTGVVSIAAVGIASGAGAVGVKDLAWSTAQVTKDGERAADEDRSKEKDHGKDREDKRDHKGYDKDRGKEVPCDSDKLIQAIIFANNNHGGVLELAKNCTYTLTRTDEHGNGLPVIKERITLKGHDTKIVRDSQADYFRILNVGRGGHLKVEGLTIKGGKTLELETLGDTPAAVWSRFSNSAEAGEAAKAGKPYLPLLQAEPKGAALDTAQAAKLKSQPSASLLLERNVNDGAGVLVQEGGTAEFEKTYIEHNQAGGVGGGIANFGKTSLFHTTVADNHAFFYGGGIFNAGILKVAESTVKNNDAVIGGGGIANGAEFIFRPDIEAGTVWVEKTEITSNEVVGFGGGLLDIGGDTTVKQSKITDNTAGLAGGGVAAALRSNLDLKEVKIADNDTLGVGGGMALALGAIANVEKSAVNDNKAGLFGGGVFNALAAVTFRDSEISGNWAGISGGGIFNVLGRVDLYNTKVSHNRSTFEPGGVFSFFGEVNVDDKSAIKANDPTNCLGIPDEIDNCFG
ncbi:right-handed parallel beta-helix repeat-containing protein [Micromonospora globbae]|uniref:Right handed beta helix domain-containing protein n=1 Tax=Micromonospora globbae TaxID=1894969 RepID=A0A420ET74_9ACTN|nr:right-handed parallel beta-helix repeat-containing protein [Micromonospora globbae]RKF23843.1 hypothetical protein D7I43_29455 [Micromonospora globbae]